MMKEGERDRTVWRLGRLHWGGGGGGKVRQNAASDLWHKENEVKSTTTQLESGKVN